MTDQRPNVAGVNAPKPGDLVPSTREPGTTLPAVCGADLGGGRRCEQAVVVEASRESAACPIAAHRHASLLDLRRRIPQPLSGFVCVWDGKRNLAAERPEREPHADRARR